MDRAANPTMDAARRPEGHHEHEHDHESRLDRSDTPTASSEVAPASPLASPPLQQQRPVPPHRPHPRLRPRVLGTRPRQPRNN